MQKLTLEALRESEERFRLFFEDAPLGYQSLDENCYFLEVNKAWLDFLGYSRDEVIGRWFGVFLSQDSREWFQKNLPRFKAAGEVHGEELKMVRKDGSIKIVSLEAKLVYDEMATFKQTHCIITDITARKQIDEEIKKSNQLMENITQGITESIFLLSKDFKILQANKAAQEECGYELEDLLQRYCYEVTHHRETPCEPPLHTCPIYELQKTGNPLTVTHIHFDAEENKLFVEVSAYPITDENGEIVQYVYVSKDITERKQSEAALQQTMHELDKRIKELKCLYGISKLVEKRDISLEELLQRIVELIPPAWQYPEFTCGRLIIEDLEFKTGNFKETVWKQTSDITVSSDRIGTVEVYYLDEKPEIDNGPFLKEERRLINGIAERVGSIIEQKRAEERIIEYSYNLEKLVEERSFKLRESEARYRGLYESHLYGITSADMEGNLVECNQAFADMFDYNKEELYKLTFWELTPSKWHKMEERIHNEQVLKRGFSEEYEKEYIKKDGTIFPVSIRVWVIKDEEGNPTGTWAIVRDITDRKQLETALKESERRYRGLYESSVDGIASADLNGNFIECNQAYADILGYTKEELLNKTYWELSPKKSRDITSRIHREQVFNRGYSDEYEKEYIRKDGTVFPISIRTWVIKDEEGNPTGTWAIVRDITQKRKIEEELRKVAKLDSISILAGGIAHDFNNILTAILSNITLAKLHVQPGNEVFDRLEEAENASIRAKDLTQQLLTFAKGAAPIKKTVCIADLAKEIVAFALSGSNVRYEFSTPDDFWSVDVDEGQIGQVINNLVINADQAMPEGGVIKIIAENITVGVENSLLMHEGNYVKLTIKDQGIGIHEEHLQKLFDPYFTTKPKGSGLGLTVAYSIIKNHDGCITVDSELGVGTTFAIYLPASEKPIPTKKEEEGLVVGKGRILVMDDDEVIREALGAILDYLGYQVEFAKNGEEAIALYEKFKDSDRPFNAVILDLTIPGGMGGKETIKRLIDLDPDVKAVVSSGYSTDPVMANFRDYGFKREIVKPYNIKTMSEILHKVIKGNDE